MYLLVAVICFYRCCCSCCCHCWVVVFSCCIKNKSNEDEPFNSKTLSFGEREGESEQKEWSKERVRDGVTTISEKINTWSTRRCRRYDKGGNSNKETSTPTHALTNPANLHTNIHMHTYIRTHYKRTGQTNIFHIHTNTPTALTK